MYGSPGYSVSPYSSHSRYITTGVTATTAGAITSAVASVAQQVSKDVTTAGVITSAGGSVTTNAKANVTLTTAGVITSATGQLAFWRDIIDGPDTTWTDVSAGPSGDWTEISDTSTIWTKVP